MRQVPAGRYKRHESLMSELCWYCERLAECVDHFPPISREAEVPQIQGWLVHSCNRCNAFLNNMLHISLNSRKLHVHEWLREKTYIQIKVIQGMTHAEIKEITGWSLSRISKAANEYKREKKQDTYEKMENAQRMAADWLKGLQGESE